MASRTTEEAASQEVDMQMTPMIDVTFLLLIFFMCSIKFKMLDGKLAAYLPRDVGVNATPVDQMMEKIDIDLVKKEGTSLGFTITINGKRVAGLHKLYLEIKSFHQRDPEAKATIYAHKGITYGNVVAVVNEILRAKLTQITFGGVPLDE